LWEFWTYDGQWHQMDVASAGPTGGGKTIYAHAAAACKSRAIRAWHNQTVGYDELQGVLYTGKQDLYDDLSCRG
jgi:hypothetical protein